MLVRMFVDPEALLKNSKAESAFHVANCDRLLGLWLKYGVLICPESEPQSELILAVNKLPVCFRKRWLTALRQQRRAFLCSDGLTSRTALQSQKNLLQLKGEVDLVCADAPKAISLGLPTASVSMKLINHQMELTRYDCLDRAEIITAIDHDWNSPIVTGSKSDYVWENKFASFARHSHHIAVVDRYCFARYLQKGPNSGLATLVNRLKKHSNSHHSLVVYAEESTVDLNAARNNLQRDIGSFGRIQSFDIVFAPGRAFSAESHDRYIRFDNIIVELGIGIEVLEGKNVKRDCLTTAKVRTTFYSDKENRLQSIASCQISVV